MQAVWLEDNKISLREVAQPAKAGEALIRVRKAGICSTDLELVKGYYPFTGISGHEFVGQVSAAPDAVAWVGKRVVGEINLGCGQCEACRAGQRTHCERRRVLGLREQAGCFAEYLT